MGGRARSRPSSRASGVAVGHMSYNEIVPERAISVRLDDEAQRALDLLTSNGRSRSEAVREALVAAARTRLLDQVREETRLVAADESDRREKAEIHALMERLRDEG